MQMYVAFVAKDMQHGGNDLAGIHRKAWLRWMIKKYR